MSLSSPEIMPWNPTRTLLFTRDEVEVQPERVRVAIADPQPLFRKALRFLLDDTPEFSVISDAADDQSLLQALRDGRPDVLLLNWEAAQANEMQLLREIAATGVPVCTVLMNVPIGKVDVAGAIRLGARAILSPDTTAEALCDAIRKVTRGEYVLGSAGIASLVASVREPSPRSPFQIAKHKFGLTRREFEIIGCVVAGYSNLEIGSKLSISAHTVKHHVTSIFDKFGISNRVEMALFVVNHHILDDVVQSS